MKMKNRAKLLVVLALFLGGVIPTVAVQADESEGGPDTSAIPTGIRPVTVEDFGSYVRVNNSGSIVKFYKGTAGYNVWYDRSGILIIEEEQIRLEYEFKPDTWRLRGEPYDFSYEQLSESVWNFTRFYTDYEDTTFNVTYTVRGGRPTKQTYSIKVGQTGVYRLVWSWSGIKSVKEQRLRVGDNCYTGYNFKMNEDTSERQGYEFEVRWTDIYEQLGNVSTPTISTQANGKKMDVHIDIGEISVGETLVIDPETSAILYNDDFALLPRGREPFVIEGTYYYPSYDGYSGVYLYYATDPSAATWTKGGLIISGDIPNFANTFDPNTNRVHIVYKVYSGGYQLNYRCFTTDISGSVNWVTPGWYDLQDICSEEGHFDKLTMAVDSAGYPWVTSVETSGGSSWYHWVFRSGTNDGTWTDDISEWPDAFQDGYSECNAMTPLNDRKMLWGHQRSDSGFSPYRVSAAGIFTHMSSDHTEQIENAQWTMSTNGTHGFIIYHEENYQNDYIGYHKASTTTFVPEWKQFTPVSDGYMGMVTDGPDLYLFRTTGDYVLSRNNTVGSKDTFGDAFQWSYHDEWRSSGSPICTSKKVHDNSFIIVGKCGYYEWPCDDYQRAVTFAWNSPPLITSASITDRDDSDNVYAMKKYYSFQAVINDFDEATDIDKMYLQIKNGANVIGEFRATSLTGTPAWAIQTGDTIFDLDTGSCSWNKNGNYGTATFKIRAEWDCAQYNDLELAVYVEDSEGESSGFTDIQTNYFDIINRLVTTGFAAADSRVNKGASVTLSGNVRYSTTTSGNTGSSSYPPNGQFTAVHIHDSGHVSKGSDTTIVNGAFSGISFNIPDAVQSNPYHVYLDLIADYTDGDAPDGDTANVIGDQVHATATSISDSRQNIDSPVNVDWTLKFDYDEAPVTSGTTTIEGTAASHQGSGVWRISPSKSTVQIATYDEFTSTSNAYGIDTVDANGQTDDVIWDRVQVQSYSASDTRHNVDEQINIDVTLWYDYDDTVVTDGAVTINGVSANHQGSGVWRISPSKPTAQAITYNDVQTSGNTYGITAEDQNGKSQQVIWDQIHCTATYASGSREDINDNVNIDFTLKYDYDEVALTDGTVTIEGFSASHQGSGVWRITRTSASVTSVTYDEFTSTGNTYGITSVDANGQSETVIWDRWGLTSFWASDDNPKTGEAVFLYAEAELEYDGHLPDGDDLVKIEDIDFNWDWVNERFYAEVNKSSAGALTYDDLTSVTEYTYDITVGTMNSLNVTVTWGDYEFNFYGLYNETGTRSGPVDVSAHMPSETQVFEVDGYENKIFTEAPEMFSWDIGGGFSRCIFPVDYNNFTVTNPESTFFVYQFTIKDYTEKTVLGDCYLEAYRAINGTETLIENRKIYLGNPVPLTLVYGRSYHLKVLFADSSRYDWGYFMSGGTFSLTMILKGIIFGDQAQIIFSDIHIEATRTPTIITVKYLDDRDGTIWANNTIRIRNGDIVVETPRTSSMWSTNWGGADPDTGYTVTVTGLHEDYGTWGRSFILDQDESFPDPPQLDGIFGDVNSNFISWVICMISLLTFSVVFRARGLIATMFTASILTYIGWASWGYDWLFFGWFLAIGVALVAGGRQ